MRPLLNGGTLGWRSGNWTMHKIFLSYAHEDLSAARRLYEVLDSIPAVQVWFDKEALLPGQSWAREIRAAISDADYFVLLLSERSARKKGFYQREIRAALDVLQELPEGRVFLIPARLDDCQVHFESLATIQYVDLFPDFAAGVTKILRSIEVHTREPTGATSSTQSTGIRLTSHQARFARNPRMCYFVNVTNTGERPVEITHLWYEDPTHHIPIRSDSRPLPRRLEVNEAWSSWIAVDGLPEFARANAYDRFRLRLSSGAIFASVKEDTVPPYGTVPGGLIGAADIDGASEEPQR
jgi:hypothetical protein